MNFNSLKNEELINLLHLKALNERRLTLEIIDLLEEVDRRSLHLERGYGSLLEFCVKELKYSEASAYRRIAAMRVTKDLPQVKKSIEDGSLNLTTVTQAQTFFRQEKKYQAKSYSKAEKLAVLKSLENKSKRESERILVQKSPDLPKPEVINFITDDKARVTLTLDEGLLKKLEHFKNKYSHINPNSNYAELIGLMADELLKSEKKDRSRKPSQVERKELSICSHESEAKSLSLVSYQHHAKPPVQNNQPKRSRSVAVNTRRLIIQRDEACCSYEDPVTRKKCGSKFQLEIDHVRAFSRGGGNEPENLRLLCRPHNQYYWRFIQSKEKAFF